MDWALAHLSFGRLDFDGVGKAWAADRIRSEIGAKWVEFIEKMQALNEAAAPAFVHQAKRFKLPLTGTF